MPDPAISVTDDASVMVLLTRAVLVLDRRRACGRYAELSAAQVAWLSDALTESAFMIHPDGVAQRREALALARRLLDDDHPEQSPLWPAPEPDRCRLCGAQLYLDAVTDPRSPLWMDADGEYATCRDGDPHIPRCW